jgi:CheY-like chemotaxis protein
VLVIDDNASSREALHELLAGWSLKPAGAAGAREGLEELERAAAQGAPYALALLDAGLPDRDGFAVAEELRSRPHLAGAVLMLLSSADRQGDAARCQALGLPASLTKPFKPAELLAAVLELLGAYGPESCARAPGAGARRGRGSAPGGLRILLAEDNLVNQRLVVGLLEKQGHRVVVVENGAAAARAVEQEDFDLVLMDVQMPQTNGLETTALIRAREEGTGRHLPIIALTAHAMKGDREQCLRAGMDAYLAKPVQGEQLLATIAEVLGLDAAGAVLPLPAAERERVFDPAALLARLGDDGELARELAALFLGESPQALRRVAEALAGGDPEAAQLAAHALKGSVGNFGAPEAVRAAARLEGLAGRADLAAARESLPALEEAVQRLRQALEEWLALPDGASASGLVPSPV